MLPTALVALWAAPAAAFGQGGLGVGLPALGSALAGTGLALWLGRRLIAPRPQAESAPQAPEAEAATFATLPPEEPAMPVLAPAPRPVPAIQPALAALCAEELRKRLPLLLEACAAGDSTATRAEAHAMRGVAANYGLADLAEALALVETAARAQQTPEMQRAAVRLPAMVKDALESLLGHAA